MKKSLLAVAALAAIAGSAQAQSSVTVYGILDVGYLNQSVKASGYANNNGAALAAAGTPVAAGVSNSSQFGSSAEQTSRLGFKGNEDLGGGLSAFFTIETGLTPTSTTVSAFNNRQTFVGLGKKGVGTASIGTQYTPIHEAVSASDPGQANNMPGNLIYAQDLSVNSTNATGSTSGALVTTAGGNVYTTALGGAASGATPYTVRAGNSVKVQSDNFAGFVGKLFYSQANQTTPATAVTAAGITTNAGGIQNAGGWGIGADYTWNKLFVTADYQSFTQKQTNLTVTNATGLVTAPTGANAAVLTGAQQVISGTTYGTALDSQDNQGYVAATYDFGILKAYAQYINRKANATYDSNQYVKRTAEQIGVRSFITPTIEAWASGSIGKLTNAYGVVNAQAASYQTVGVNMTAWQLGSNYWLSKRTNLYAIVGQQRTSNGVYPTTVNGNSVNVNAVSSSLGAYALGVRHTF